MPKVRRSKKAPPEGWELIEPTLEELEQKMREAETEPHEGKRKQEALWPIFKIHHQKSRYIYDLFYRRKAISRELYDYCLTENIADKNLIAKWKKTGYENLCCLRCIQTRDTNFGTNCICRVPKGKLEEVIYIANLYFFYDKTYLEDNGVLGLPTFDKYSPGGLAKKVPRI